MKANEPTEETPYELVTLKRYKAEDKLPEIQATEFPEDRRSKWVLMFHKDGCPVLAQLYEDNEEYNDTGKLLWDADEGTWDTAGTSWAYIPEV